MAKEPSATSRGFTLQRSPKFKAARDAVKERYARLKAEGKTYPSRIVDAYDPEATLWWGKVPYDVETLDRLDASYALMTAPVVLPDDFVLDGECHLPNESEAEFRMYEAWRDLGNDRTFPAAARALGLPEGNTHWKVIAAKHRWKERVDLWEADLHARTQAAIERKIDESVDHFAERRTRYLEREISLVERGVERLEEMLGLPIVDKIVEERDGKTIHHYHAANWDYRALAAVLAEVQKLGRLHFGLSTSNASQKIEQSISGTVTHAVAADDSRNMSPAHREAHEYAARVSEEAYFRALEEFMGRGGPKVIASVASEATG